MNGHALGQANGWSLDMKHCGFVFPVFLLAFLSLPTAARWAPVPAGRDLEARARAWLAEGDLTPEGPGDLDLDSLLDRRFLRFELGSFEVYVPPDALADSAWNKDLRGVLTALLDLQAHWIEWYPHAAEGSPGTEKDLGTLRSWVRSLTAKRFRGKGAPGAGPVLEALAPKEAVRSAAAAFSAYMRAGGPLAGERKPLRRPRVVLLPTRGDFIGFAAALGWISPRHRSFFWDPGLYRWTTLDFDGLRACALEFPSLEATADSPGVPMNARNPRAMAEHVTQVAARALFEAGFGPDMEPMLAAGLANHLVIEIFGEVDTRTDGDTRGRRTLARSVFIPGGNPNGGTLPPNNADSRWRESRGADHFVKVLRRAQKAGAKEAPSRAARHLGFQLLSESGSERCVVRAPFLGPAAGTATGPDSAFQGDYLEFLRAYRAAFLFWLHERAGGKSGPSRERFGRFLRRLARPGAGGDLAGALEEVYGAPLSAAFPDRDCLEGRFLLWLTGR